MEQGTAHAIAKEHRQTIAHRREELKQQKLLEKQKYGIFDAYKKNIKSRDKYKKTIIVN